MQYSIGVEYTLHTLFYMVEIPSGYTVAIKNLALLNGLSETYLSKIFSKLKKHGIVRSVPGIRGGYELAKNASEISFWDVVEAVEGSSYIYQCTEIRKNNIFSEDPSTFQCPCLIKVIMTEAEEKMRDYLKSKSLAFLYAEAFKEFTPEKTAQIARWRKDIIEG